MRRFIDLVKYNNQLRKSVEEELGVLLRFCYG
jgi:hypothetical protein